MSSTPPSEQSMTIYPESYSVVVRKFHSTTQKRTTRFFSKISGDFPRFLLYGSNTKMPFVSAKMRFHQTICVALLVAGSIMGCQSNTAPSAGKTNTQDKLLLKQIETQPKRLCEKSVPLAPKRSEKPNPNRQTLKELFSINGPTTVLFASSDIASESEIAKRLDNVLASRPRLLWTTISWSEGPDFSRESFTASLTTKGLQPIRIEVTGYQVCVVDTTGDVYFFRNVQADSWDNEK